MNLFFWRKKEPSLSLYQRIINNPQSVQESGAKYPPAAAGIDYVPMEAILAPQKELLINIDQNTETAGVFIERYWPAIERFAGLVHLIPASENDHHNRPGGMLHHGLETGLLTMNFAKASLYGKDKGILKKDARERWLFGSCVAGMVHDIGKIEIDVKITSENGEVWSPHLESLDEWVIRNKVKKYYVDWRADRYREHEHHALGLLNKVLTDEDKHYLDEIDSNVLKEVMHALMGYSRESGEQDWPKNLKQMLKIADSLSVKKDLERSRTPEDLGLERGTPLIRHYHDGMRRLFKDRKWLINDFKNGVAWVLGENKELYLVWEICARQLYDSLVESGVKGSPNKPDEIADVMARHELIDISPDGSYYWRIQPENEDGVKIMPQKAVRINAKFVRNLVEVLPSGINGSAHEEEDLIWSSGKHQSDGIDKDLESPPAQENKGQDLGISNRSEESPQAPPLQLVPPPGKPSGPSEDANSEISGEIEKKTPPAASHASLRSFKTLLAGVGIGLLLTIIYFLHFATAINPDISYRTAFWMMAGAAFDNGIFVIFLLSLGAIYTGILIIPFIKRDIENARKAAAEIKDAAQREAKETKEEAVKEAQEIRAEAEKEGQEFIDAAQEIKDQAEERRNDILEQAEIHLLEVQSEASEIVDRARDEAKLILSREKAQCKDLWEWCHFKAKEAGVTPEEWIGIKKLRNEAQEVLEKARREAEAIIGRACDQSENYPQQRMVEEKDHEEVDNQCIKNELTESDNLKIDSNQENLIDVLKDKIFSIILEHRELRKRDLERKVSKFRYENAVWDLAINSLMMEEKVMFDSEAKIYKVVEDSGLRLEDGRESSGAQSLNHTKGL